MDIQYDFQLVEIILHELDINVTQEEILGTIFKNFIFEKDKKLLPDLNSYIDVILNVLVCKEIKDTFKNDLQLLIQIFQQYFHSILEKIKLFDLKYHSLYVDWNLSRFIVIDPDYQDQFNYIVEHGQFKYIESSIEKQYIRYSDI